MEQTIDHALIRAVKYNNLPAVKMCVEKGADVNYYHFSSPVLKYAALYSDIDIIRYLCENGAEVNYKINGRMPWTALTPAAGKGNMEVIDYLLEQDAKIDKHTLAYSLRNGQFHIFKYLLEKSSMSTDDSILLQYWLHMAVISGSIESVRYLLQRGANADAAGRHGANVISYTTRRRDIEMVKYLYSMGSNPYRIDTRIGMNALERRKHKKGVHGQETIDFLREAMKHRVLPLRNLCIIIVYRLRVPHFHIPEAFFDIQV